MPETCATRVSYTRMYFKEFVMYPRVASISILSCPCNIVYDELKSKNGALQSVSKLSCLTSVLPSYYSTVFHSKVHDF